MNLKSLTVHSKIRQRAGAIYLLDRNVVSLIKDVVAGRVIDDHPLKRKFLARLRSLDYPSIHFSPLLSIVEGKYKGNDTATQKSATQREESTALKSFFKYAIVDTDHLNKNSSEVGKTFTQSSCVKWELYEDFYANACPKVINVQKAKRSRIENELLLLAEANGLASDTFLIMVFMACLHGTPAAIKVVKPAAPDAHNALSDLTTVHWQAVIRDVAWKIAKVRIHTELLTMDQGLENVLSSITITGAMIQADETCIPTIRCKKKLFPNLDSREFKGLLDKVTSFRENNH